MHPHYSNEDGRQRQIDAFLKQEITTTERKDKLPSPLPLRTRRKLRNTIRAKNCSQRKSVPTRFFCVHGKRGLTSWEEAHLSRDAGSNLG